MSSFPRGGGGVAAHWLLVVMAAASMLVLVVAQDDRHSLNHHSASSSSSEASVFDLSTTKDQNEPDDIYDILKVRRPNGGLFPRLKRWSGSWKWHGRILPLLHLGQGDACPPEVFVNLRVLWNKALTSLDPTSPANEASQGYPTFLLLPKISRWILFKAVPIRWYPRWMHANIELRTVYLNQAMDKEIQHVLLQHSHNNPEMPQMNIELVVLGAGYDTRSIRTLAKYHPHVSRAWELDLEPVVKSKQKLVERMFQQVSPRLLSSSVQDSVRYIAVDLNDLNQVEDIFRAILQDRQSRGMDPTGRNNTHTIIVTEAILFYLDENANVPAKILQLCQEYFGSSNVSWLVVDRIKAIPQPPPTQQHGSSSILYEKQAAIDYFASIGWQVLEWWIKPGATRHMGTLRPFLE